MIPKIIHYCWFGRGAKPEIVETCVRSWKAYCPDYELREWNEDSYDLSAAPLYVRQAYEAKRWAFVTDFVRLDVVSRYGGVYLDTDVELIRPLDGFLQYEAFFAFDNDACINTGLGFGCERGAPILAELMADYRSIPFLLDDGRCDVTPCPERNTAVFLRRGLRREDTVQRIDGMMFFPSEYFSPLSYHDRVLRKTENTVGIHWYMATWHNKRERRAYERRLRRMKRAAALCEKRDRLVPLIGEKNFDRLVNRLRRTEKNGAAKRVFDAVKGAAKALVGANVYAALKRFKNKLKYRR